MEHVQSLEIKHDRIYIGAHESISEIINIENQSTPGPQNTQDIIAIGAYTLQKNTTGEFNTAIGHESLMNNISGHGNTTLGHSALQLGIGSGNTVIGSQTAHRLVNGFNNVMMGTQSGGEEFQSGQNNIIIGSQITMKNDISNSICLGYHCQVKSNNEFVLGSLEAPLKVSKTGNGGNLPILNPEMYLEITLNGQEYKLPLYLK